MKKIYLFSLLTVLLTSCLSTSRINVQVLKPAKIAIPRNIIKISLVDNSNLIRGNYFLKITKGEKITTKKELDSTLSRSMMNGFMDVLDNSPRFYFNDKYSYFRKKTISSKYDLLDWDEVNRICNKDTSDALVALEAFTITDTSTKPVVYNSNSGQFTGSMVLHTAAIWRIYYPYADNRYTDIKVKDSIKWEVSSYSSADVAMSIPDREWAIDQAAYKAGKTFGGIVAQQWEKADRFIYSSGSAPLRLAAEYVSDKKWEEAIKIWEENWEQSKNDKKMGAALAYNLAVGNEMIDKMEEALEWAAKSYFLNPKPEVDTYIHLLEKRKSEKAIIESQYAE